MRKYFLLILIASMFSFSGLAQAAPQVILNGQSLSFDVPPVIENDRTLVPLRAIFEALGASVQWDGESQMVTANKAGTEIKLIIGGSAYKNGTPVNLDIRAKIISNRTMVPLRFIAESLGCQVSWDDATQTVTITSSDCAGADSRDSFVFDVLGDSKILPDHEQWQGNRVLSEAIERINQDHPALVVYLGDGVDQGGPLDNLNAFRRYMTNLQSSWYPAIGNHELYNGSNGGNGEDNFQQVFADKLPVSGVSYYSFNYQKTHFIVLDTAWQTGDGPKEAELKPGSQQWEWLCHDLATARPLSQHIFIFDHKPPVSPFHAGGPDTESNLPDGHGSSWGDPMAAAEFIKLVANYHVDAVFSGHIHMYNRMDVQGVPYFITAGAGASLYAPPESGGYYHYLRCHVDGDQASYEVIKLTVPG